MLHVFFPSMDISSNTSRFSYRINYLLRILIENYFFFPRIVGIRELIKSTMKKDKQIFVFQQPL